MSREFAHVDETTKLRNDPKSSMAKNDRDKLELRESMEVIEEVMQTGGDDAVEAAKAVRHYEGERQRTEKERTDDILNQLDAERNRRFGAYKTLLAKALVDYLQMLDWIKGWRAHVLMTDGAPIRILGKSFETQDGILLVVMTPDGRVFHQGIRLSRDPVVDYMAIQTMTVATENQLDHEKGLLLDRQHLAPQGIVGPDGKPTSSNERK